MTTNNEMNIARKCGDSCTVEDLMARIQGLTEEEKKLVKLFVDNIVR